MKKLTLIKQISKLTNLPLHQTNLTIEALIITITQNLANGNTTTIRKLGTFYLKYQKPMPNWHFGNVKTPQKEKAIPAFKPAPTLKYIINNAPCQKNPKQFMSPRTKAGGRPWELKKDTKNR